MSVITHNNKVVVSGNKALNFDNLIALANATTGESDKTLAEAISSLIDGYGGGSGLEQYATNLRLTASYVNSQKDIVLNIPLCTSTANMFNAGSSSEGDESLLESVSINTPGETALSYQGFAQYQKQLKRITFVNGATFAMRGLQQSFRNCESLIEIVGEIGAGDGITWTYDAFVSAFDYCYALEEVRFKKNTMKLMPNFRYCRVLSDDSIVSIANAMVEGTATLTLNNGRKTVVESIVGTVTDNEFTKGESGDTTLLDFINNTKGWTVAYQNG